MSKKKVLKATEVFLLLLLISYFLFHILSGTRGVIKLMDLNAQLKQKEIILFQTKLIEHKLEQKIKGMSSANIDLDLLEEEVRKSLGYIKDEEKVLFN